MKIVFVASVYRHIKSFHIPYIKYLQGRGYEVYVMAASDEETKKELTGLGCKCIDIPFSRSPFKSDNLRAFKVLKNYFCNQDFNLVHVHTPLASLLTRLAFRHSKRGKIMYTAHGFHFFKGAPILNWIIYYPLERFAARFTDEIITINEEDYKRALKMGYKKNSVHYVHGVGVDEIHLLNNSNEKKEIKKKLGISEDSIVISYIAEINKNKNHIFLLQNWNRIKEQSPNTTLLFIGEGELRSDIENYIKNNQLIDIHLLGYRSDVNKLLSITDVVSLLSHREGLPKSIMEAMVTSIPCVVSDTRGLRDLVTDGESGYVVDHNNDEKLVSSFVSLLNNKEKREEMGKDASKNIEPYLLQNVLKEYVEIYEDVLGNE
ncbi:Glycosyltransferase involved in cell wall bisynthesis [Paenisporosarcina quisquiliarum]|nr:Glycosyltransferase involved in cell wall bisynthesis [Paenisporosarcina quisquiliarum]